MSKEEVVKHLQKSSVLVDCEYVGEEAKERLGINKLTFDELFLNHYKAIQKTLGKKIRQQNFKADFPIVITGHGLGAALAILCAIDFPRLIESDIGDIRDRLNCYIFGCPQIPTEFQKILDQSLNIFFHIADVYDPIPGLPYDPYHWNYIAPFNTVHLCKTYMLWNYEKYSRGLHLANFNPNISCHTTDNYQKYLSQAYKCWKEHRSLAARNHEILCLVE